MVAGASSCSCPECGVICTGKFPGCSAVWAAGPRQVTLRRPTTELGGRSVPQAAATNGTRAASGRLLPAVAGHGPRTEPTAEVRPLTEVLSADVEALRRQVDDVRRSTMPSDPLGEATLRALSVLENLPQRIAVAAGEALRQQHELNLRDLKEQWDQFAAQAERLAVGQPRPAQDNRATGNARIVGRATEDGRGDRQLSVEEFRKEWRQLAAEIEMRLDDHMKQVVSRVRATEVQVAARAIKEMAAGAATDRATIIGMFEDRFAWLVTEVSDRFVTLGNELARIERRLADEASVAQATNGHVRGHAPAPRE